MKNLTKTLLGALTVAGSFAGNAFAQDATPDFTLSGYAAAQSDYRFRGISQNGKEVTPEASLNLVGPDGFYVGTWAAKTNWGGNNPSFEADFFGGKHFDLGGTDLNVEAYYYSYPDFRAAGSSASFYETIVQLTHAFGPLTGGGLAVGAVLLCLVLAGWFLPIARVEHHRRARGARLARVQAAYRLFRRAAADCGGILQGRAETGRGMVIVALHRDALAGQDGA